MQNETVIDTKFHYEIMPAEETAQYLRKSARWIYMHWMVLGGRKLVGSFLSPRKERIYEHIFCQRQGVEV